MRLPLGVVAAVVAATTFFVAAPAASQPEGLSIQLSDGVTVVESGAELTYVATVANTFADPVDGTLVLSIPNTATSVIRVEPSSRTRTRDG